MRTIVGKTFTFDQRTSTSGEYLSVIYGYMLYVSCTENGSLILALYFLLLPVKCLMLWHLNCNMIRHAKFEKSSKLRKVIENVQRISRELEDLGI